MKSLHYITLYHQLSFLNKEALGAEYRSLYQQCQTELMVTEDIKLLINKLESSGVTV
jgi:hypothetical protein